MASVSALSGIRIEPPAVTMPRTSNVSAAMYTLRTCSIKEVRRSDREGSLVLEAGCHLGPRHENAGPLGPLGRAWGGS